MKLFVDDDGYICFYDGEIFWTLHFGGWEAYLPGESTPCFSTYSYTFPTDDEVGEVYEIYENWLEEDNKE